jgi:hypothetical protein
MMDLLKQVKIASPCHADWNAMAGNEQVRFCGSCQKNVFNLSAMTQSEAATLIQETEGTVCVRFYRRADGTMLTSDCPVGVRAQQQQNRRTLAATLLASAGIGAALALSHRGSEPTIRVLPMAPIAAPAPTEILGEPTMGMVSQWGKQAPSTSNQLTN